MEEDKMNEKSIENGAVLGIDWGTTNRRAYLLDAKGSLLRRHEDAMGILAVEPGRFAPSLAALLQSLGLERVDVIMSGMVGSRNGWQQVPYLDKEHALFRLPEALVDVDAPINGVRCRIVPGYCAVDACGTPDVMRGEETQILGAMPGAASSGWYLLPGTHSKWVYVQDGHVEEIITYMTGELFALLSEHGTLSSLVKEGGDVREAFEAGLQVAQRSSFTHAAFGCRALVVTDTMPASHASSYLSGLLIGAEFAGIRQKAGDYPRGTVQIVGSPKLAERYVDALGVFDMQSRVWQPDDVYVAALRRLAGITYQEE
jgi:2-dehydro-3-deoxygalactonokinase